MKSRFVIAALAVCLCVGSNLLAENTKPEDTKCPVSGKPSKASESVEFEGGKVYFCCGNCPKAFEKNTEKFAAKARQQMMLTGELEQVHCPITHKAFKAEQTVDVGGVTIAFCCGTCKGKVEKQSADEQVTTCFAKADCFKATAK